MITLDSIELSGDLWWKDELWTPVEQVEGFNLDGSLDVECSVKLAGRPITLEGGEDLAWLTRQTVLDLLALASIPGKKMTLTLADGRTFNVMFRRNDSDPVQAEPVFKICPPLASHTYANLTIRLMVI